MSDIPNEVMLQRQSMSKTVAHYLLVSKTSPAVTGVKMTGRRKKEGERWNDQTWEHPDALPGQTFPSWPALREALGGLPA